MAQFDPRSAASAYPTRTGAAVDEGLRSYMLGVYNYMAAGVALTGVAAYVTAATTNKHTCRTTSAEPNRNPASRLRLSTSARRKPAIAPINNSGVNGAI